MDQFPATADVVVVGGGIMGSSIAWHLTRSGAGRVVLLERATIASGASGRTGALLRRHYSNRPEALLAQHSHVVFENWANIVGGDCGFVPWGLVVTVDQSPEVAENVELLERNVAMQRELGIDARVVTAGELRELQPWVWADDIQTAAYEPTSGYADSVAATTSMADAAQREGVSIQEWTETLAIRVNDGGVVGVETTHGAISTRNVVLAAGPWTTQLASTAGVLLPVAALRVQIAIVHRPRELREPPFVFLDMAAGFFTRPWGPGRSLVGVGGGDQHDEVDPADWVQGNDPAYPAAAIEAASRRIPAMARASYQHGHAGLYDMTPDTHPIIGPAGPDGLVLACGFSGAGFKKGPAVGQCVAELVTSGKSQLVDLAPFRLDRFDTDAWRNPWSDTEYRYSTDFGHRL